MTLWRKKYSVIEARPMPVVFHLEVEGGRQRGMPGDYLCKSEDGAEWIMDEGTLRAGYEPLLSESREREEVPATLLLSVRVYRNVVGHLVADAWWAGFPPTRGPAECEEAVVAAQEWASETIRKIRRGQRPDQDASPETVR